MIGTSLPLDQVPGLLHTLALALQDGSVVLVEAIFMCFARLMRSMPVSFFHPALFWIAVSALQVPSSSLRL